MTRYNAASALDCECLQTPDLGEAGRGAASGTDGNAVDSSVPVCGPADPAVLSKCLTRFVFGAREERLIETALGSSTTYARIVCEHLFRRVGAYSPLGEEVTPLEVKSSLNQQTRFSAKETGEYTGYSHN